MAVVRVRQTSGVNVVGLDQFRRALHAMGPEWQAALLKVHKQVSDRGAEWAQWELASSGSRMQRLAVGAIKGTGTSKAARIGVSSGKGIPFALAAVWGAKRRSGWYAAGKYGASTGRQFPEWVGNTWDVAVAGQGPYGINPALAEHLEDILDFYQEGIDRLAAAAFPE